MLQTTTEDTTGIVDGSIASESSHEPIITTTSQLKRRTRNKQEIYALQSAVNKQKRAAAAILKRRFDKMSPETSIIHDDSTKGGKGRPPLPREVRKYSRHIVATDSIWDDLLLLSDFYGVTSRSEVIAQLVKEKFVRLKEQHAANPDNPFSI
jgi:hypothetical protein